MQKKSFSQRIIDWFQSSGRKNLPWQKNKTAYRVWVSEIMLQQTQVATVIPYFKNFINRFPENKDLACAELEEVLEYWAGLGYYSRVRNLHKTARIIHNDLMQQFPLETDALQTLPGIGKSTANAILALYYDKKLPILDSNVKRILTRHQNIAGLPNSNTVSKQLWQLSEKLLPEKHIADYTQALMDLGATICTHRTPNCQYCPVYSDCKARIANTIDQRPERKPVSKKPIRHTTMLFVYCKQDILLERRPPTGIWGSLLCPPEFNNNSELNRWRMKYLGIILPMQKGEQIMHHFTHFSLYITPLYINLSSIPTPVMEKNVYVWCKMRPQLAIPAPVKRLLKPYIR